MECEYIKKSTRTIEKSTSTWTGKTLRRMNPR